MTDGETRKSIRSRGWCCNPDGTRRPTVGLTGLAGLTGKRLMLTMHREATSSTSKQPPPHPLLILGYLYVCLAGRVAPSKLIPMIISPSATVREPVPRAWGFWFLD